jgi:hypothetical protein
VQAAGFKEIMLDDFVKLINTQKQAQWGSQLSESNVYERVHIELVVLIALRAS